jgi:hypothetical protein
MEGVCVKCNLASRIIARLNDTIREQDKRLGANKVEHLPVIDGVRRYPLEVEKMKLEELLKQSAIQCDKLIKDYDKLKKELPVATRKSSAGIIIADLEKEKKEQGEEKMKLEEELNIIKVLGWDTMRSTLDYAEDEDLEGVIYWLNESELGDTKSVTGRSLKLVALDMMDAEYYTHKQIEEDCDEWYESHGETLDPQEVIDKNVDVPDSWRREGSEPLIVCWRGQSAIEVID